MAVIASSRGFSWRPRLSRAAAIRRTSMGGAWAAAAARRTSNPARGSARRPARSCVKRASSDGSGRRAYSSRKATSSNRAYGARSSTAYPATVSRPASPSTWLSRVDVATTPSRSAAMRSVFGEAILDCQYSPLTLQANHEETRHQPYRPTLHAHVRLVRARGLLPTARRQLRSPVPQVLRRRDPRGEAARTAGRARVPVQGRARPALQDGLRSPRDERAPRGSSMGVLGRDLRLLSSSRGLDQATGSARSTLSRPVPGGATPTDDRGARPPLRARHPRPDARGRGAECWSGEPLPHGRGRMATVLGRLLDPSPDLVRGGGVSGRSR